MQTALDFSGKVPAAPYDPAPLAGTAPSYTTQIVIIPHKHRRGSSWPSHIDSVSPLLSELSSRSKEGGSLEGCNVNLAELLGPSRELAAWEADIASAGGASSTSAPLREWDSAQSRFLRAPPGGAADDELYAMLLYRDGKAASIQSLSFNTLDQGSPLVTKIEDALSQAKRQTARSQPKDVSDIFVCIHGSRDCRCGIAGGELCERLEEETRKYRERTLLDGAKPKRIRIWGIGHVGGHKWAANAIVQPSGDWYGNLRNSDAPLVLRSALAPPTSSYDFEDKREKLVHWSRWRGRQGLSKEQMAEKYEHWGPPTVQTAIVVPKARAPAAAASGVIKSTTGSQDSATDPVAVAASSSELQATPQAPRESAATGQPVTLRFVDWQGEEHEVHSTVGETIKDAAKRANLPSIEATCGGVCECATCHVYLVTPTRTADASLTVDAPKDAALPFAPRQRFSIQSPPSASALVDNPKATPMDEEQDMLEYAIGREESSRLACQLISTPQLASWMQNENGRILLPRF
ncbi:related to lip5-lipoic acid synthase [Ceraceosorus bombacis]|uniref:Related to lip5-lipoic acid synthase n=1 Tax=Ceraceosorus bombacis TaxID=401625 RepID=A0A0P1BD30_9BASI|nr:related to lip5-lipoic acid synthase [Ceraceosorus bombacis]